ncbi:ATP-binding cassette domain-containing protein [Nocardia cyriacigeorgica]|uniref:ATP-binding cassette domain-containing protein n=1 Tax=Nocardia cyriacigeorgica TaxID=135487 RepID=UPI000CEB3FDA|nr:ATP-binding cassette domain-containing protein [Nocardia cyriacigeorgica]AVH21480.1 daunorubicin/doxorubicin resistance ABC transporter ATP-binding protein DrrA [Nocardia cyriacigeorgica]MBF6315536.1 ATP-binding cassette domain-containing protein [Nocardia cyriacigeorgica]MBF6320915.1 ATP-binding cassette domain-containing protein [Nocardia cyriacigeorgica]MBF6342934.1 ATP-binding cassette domain-containing protein [Nocardia cyriacigeorgica]MBF6394186.1 ATP-binding cassette domain-containin
MGDAIVAEGLVKRYGQQVALDGLDLTVPEGTVTALLGPNGAGKTTTVRVLTTLLIPDGGRATVAGIDVLRDPRALRRRIGASGQYAAVDEYLTGFENLEMVGRLYHMGVQRSKERARELLDRFRLSDAADRPVKGYSGGMRRRLDLAGALVAAPPVLFLDEPTTGLDPRARLDLWDVIEELVAGGTTLLLTTQYMEEADRLADSIAVIDRGKVIAKGTADELKTMVGGDRIELTVDHVDNLAIAQQALAGLADGEIHLEPGLRRIIVPVSNGSQALVEAVGRLNDHSVKIHDVGLRRPSLDDVFLTLTGHEAEELIGADDAAEGLGALEATEGKTR